MKTNPNPTRRWLSPLLFAACGLLWSGPAPAHDDDPGRRPGFFSRLFNGGHHHKAPRHVVVEEPQVVERVTTVTYPDGHVERFVDTSPAVESTVREEVPALNTSSMRSVRERPVTEVPNNHPEPGLRLPDGYVADPAPRVSRPPAPEPKLVISSRAENRPATTPQSPTPRTREIRSEAGVVASTGNDLSRDSEPPRAKQRPAPVEKKSKPATKTPRSETTAARDLTSAAPANFLEENPPSTAIKTVQKKFDHTESSAPPPSKEDPAPPQKMLIGAKGQTPADLPPTKEKTHAPNAKDPAPTGKKYPVASRTEKPGFLKSPYQPFNQLDATGLISGSLARDPTTGKIFRVP